MKYLRKPTKKQWPMVILMGIVWTALLLWAYPEVAGVVSPAVEDTYSEWVWDLPLWGLIIVVLLHLIAGVLLLWSGGHFIEGYVARRARERQ